MTYLVSVPMGGNRSVEQLITATDQLCGQMLAQQPMDQDLSDALDNLRAAGQQVRRRGPHVPQVEWAVRGGHVRGAHEAAEAASGQPDLLGRKRTIAAAIIEMNQGGG